MPSDFPETALIGAGGQLATDLAALLPVSSLLLSHQSIEITEPASIARALDGFRGQMVLNTAGYNLVDQAESEPERAFAINAFGPRHLAKYCHSRGLKLVHISTDYVFDRDSHSSIPLVEPTLPNPGSVYAASKWAGEQFVRVECPDHLVIRTCGLYGIAATKSKSNFIETMLRLAQTRSEIAVVDDQHCTPSFTQDVSAAIVELLRCDARGTFHVTNSGGTTWRQLACEVFRLQNLPVTVRPITTTGFGAKARRPAYSVLDCSQLERTIGRPMPPWQDAVRRYLAIRSA